MDRDPDEEVVRQPLAALEHGLLGRHVQLDHPFLPDVLDVARSELVEEPLRDLGRDRDRRGHRRNDANLRLVPDATLDELVVQEERAFERRRRALVRLAEDADQDLSARERGERGVAHLLGSRDRVVLEAAGGEARSCCDVVLGAQGDDEDVGVVRASVGRDVSARGVDRGDALLAELDARLREPAVGDLHLGRVRMSEQDVELREPEREPVALVDQRHPDLVGNGLGEPSRELQSGETGAEDHNVLHARQPYGPRDE